MYARVMWHTLSLWIPRKLPVLDWAMCSSTRDPGGPTMRLLTSSSVKSVISTPSIWRRRSPTRIALPQGCSVQTGARARVLMRLMGFNATRERSEERGGVGGGEGRGRVLRTDLRRRARRQLLFERPYSRRVHGLCWSMPDRPLPRPGLTCINTAASWCLQGRMRYFALNIMLRSRGIPAAAQPGTAQ